MSWPTPENFTTAFVLVGFSIYGLAYAPLALVVLVVLLAVVVPLLGYSASRHRKG